MEMGKVALGSLVDQLVKNGHVERKPEPGDRRANRVVLTGEGRRLLTRIQTIGETLDLGIMGGVRASEMLRAETVLREMKTRLIDMGAVPGHFATTTRSTRRRRGPSSPQRPDA